MKPIHVIKLTLEKSLNVLEECGQDYLAVTYDLATAKLAIRIQEQESPRFNKLFVLLGNFHLEGSYFGALGYIIDCSGITDILVRDGDSTVATVARAPVIFSHQNLLDKFENSN